MECEDVEIEAEYKVQEKIDLEEMEIDLEEAEEESE